MPQKSPKCDKLLLSLCMATKLESKRRKRGEEEEMRTGRKGEEQKRRREELTVQH